MSHPDYARAYAVAVLCLGTAAVFFLTGVTPLPVLLYFPLSRRFGFSANAGELSMDYYGRSLLALLAGFAAALCTYAAFYVFKREQPEKKAEAVSPQGAEAPPVPRAEKTAAQGRALLLLTAYALTALLLSVGLFAYQLSVRVLAPEPLPPVSGSKSAAEADPESGF